MSDYYAAAPADQVERLMTFRRAHPPRQTTINGMTWEYLSCGQGEATILWLVGGLRVADAAYRSIPLLEDHFRILAPSYPPLMSMDVLVDGLVRLLDASGVGTAHVLAGSFGGMVAQALLRRHPGRVNKVVLSTTAVLDEKAVANYQQQEAMIASAPSELVAEFSKGRFVEMIAPPNDERTFWTAYVDELFSERLTKDDMLSTVRCLLDFAQQPQQPQTAPEWAGRILIIESEDDATFDAAARARLKALYPSARVHTYTNGGHSPATTQREAYFGLVRGFFSG